MKTGLIENRSNFNALMIEWKWKEKTNENSRNIDNDDDDSIGN